MPRMLPPIEHRFTKENAPHVKGPRGPYLLPLLKRCLNKTITVPNPENVHGELIKMQVKDAIVWRRILNACEGDDLAIERIFDRIDGKVAEVIKEIRDDSALMNDEIELVPNNGKKLPNRISKFINN